MCWGVPVSGQAGAHAGQPSLYLIVPEPGDTAMAFADVFSLLQQHIRCGLSLSFHRGTVPGSPEKSPALLEPSDIPALLQVSDALVVILLGDKAMVAVGLRGALFFLSV